ncbi:LuxR C-terminal-related transcriptional regulator [Rhodococcus sp. 14-2483-1-2]|uniref:response regulator transcription factor n=1 Tax=Rhodococcus sp. 14-2483-1-2 TaxID=2023147 RepID=UPI0014839DD9|nr:LuxR C-terminal-related transcriptional regulator [Rhodococcus sp. 14-2483-1-2]
MQIVYEHPGQLLTWADIPAYRSTFSAERVLVPAGFHEGASVALTNNSGRTVAVLHISIVEQTFLPWLKSFVAEIAQVAVSTVCALELRSRMHLTPREVDILRCLTEGQTNAEIGAALHLSRSTVNTHMEHILHKLGAKKRLSAVVLAYKAGLLENAPLAI